MEHILIGIIDRTRCFCSGQNKRCYNILKRNRFVRPAGDSSARFCRKSKRAYGISAAGEKTEAKGGIHKYS